MKHRYMLFGGEIYYAKGGFHDYICSGDSLEKLSKLGDQGVDEGAIRW